MSLSSLALADIAPDPCEGKNEGDACITVREERGTCVAVDCGSGGSGGRVDCGTGLECVAGTASTTGSGGAGGSGGTTSASGGNAASGSGGEGNTGNAAPSDAPESDDGCSLKSGGTQRGASTLAAMAALALGVWISRRRAR